MSGLWRETNSVMYSQFKGNIKQTTTTIQNPTAIHNPAAIHNPISIPRPTITNGREDQSSPVCWLIRAFAAQPINHTPGSNYLRQRQNRHTKYHGAGPRPARVV